MRERSKIDDSILIEDIKKVSEKLGKIPSQQDYKQEGSFALNTIINRRPWTHWLNDIFGCTDSKYKKDQIPDTEIIKDIQQLGIKLDKIPTQDEYKQYGFYSLSRLSRRKRWNEWLKLAYGIVNHNCKLDPSNKISDQELQDDLRRVASELGHIPTHREYNKMGYYSSDTIISRKPWIDFIQECEINLPKPTDINKRKISNEELIKQLINLKEKLGRTPRKEDLGGENAFCSSVYARAFGTLGNALVAAGLIDPINRYCVSRQELINELQRVYKLLGCTPSGEEFLENSPMTNCGRIHAEFGSWTQALLAANIPIIVAHKVSAEDIKIALKKWHDENNNDDTCLEYWKIRKAKQNMKFPYSCNTISAKFDFVPWENVMHECGFPNYTTKDYFVHGQMKRGNHTGQDGNEYLSTIEKDIGNRLFELKTNGKIFVYEYEVRVCAEKLWTCDFKITFPNGVILWLEADGMRKTRKDPYTSGTNEKIEFYKRSGIKYEIISYNCSDICQAVDKIVDKFQTVI